MTAQEKYDAGYPTFKKLFDMSKDELKKVLVDIIPQHEETIKGGNVRKVMLDDEPYEMEVNYYSSISITPFGINYKPEHGPGGNVILFNKYFVIPNENQ